MTLKVGICDDDIEFSNQLKQTIQDFFEENSLNAPCISIYHNGETLLSDTEPMDIVFLDVEMPGLNGIYVGNKLKERNENIIIFIVTSYVEYLDEAMRFHVFRYLSKPLDLQRLFRNMKDALQLYHTTVTKILIETKQKSYTIPASDIISVEACGRQVTVHTRQQDFVSVHPMSYWIQTLHMPCFFPTHRSFIVNLKYVSDFDHFLIHLYDNQFEAYLTRRKYTQFKEAYLLYLESAR
jgi:two-component system LytT family response regulator